MLLFLGVCSSCDITRAIASGSNTLGSLLVIKDGVSYAGIVNEDSKEIVVLLPWGIEPEGFTVDVRVPDKATYKLEEPDYFYVPQKLTVTAQDGSINVYTLRILNKQSVDLTDSRITFLGCRHIKRTADQIFMSRLGDESLSDTRLNYMSNGNTQSGVIIRFATSSQKVRLLFKEIEGPHWGKDYGVWANGKFYGSIASHDLLLTNPNDTLPTVWEVSPSLMNAVSLVKMELSAGSHLEIIKESSKPVYFAIGNSITQGVGQGNAGYKSYPFLLGKSMEFEVVNLAVGGSKLSPAVAKELKDEQANLITVLWGFNDWAYEGIPPEQFFLKYKELVEQIRLYQPSTPLLCVGFINTEYQTPANQQPIDVFRWELSKLVMDCKSRGDANIEYFDASGIAVELMDGVHPSVTGASQLAAGIEAFIKQNQVIRRVADK